MNDTKTVVALGTFDGVHLGHRHLLETAVSYGHQHNLKSVVFSFLYPPAQFFSQNIRLLTDKATKESLIKALGIDEVVWVEFDQEFARIPPEKFVQHQIVNELNAAWIVCGANYHFGSQAVGDWHLLTDLGRQFGFGVQAISPLTLDNEIISSSRIRNLLQAGEVDAAARLLGRYQSYFGKARFQPESNVASFSLDPQFALPGPGLYLAWYYWSNIQGGPCLVAINPGLKLFFFGPVPDQATSLGELQFLHKLSFFGQILAPDELDRLLPQAKSDALGLVPEFRLQDQRIVLR